MLLMLSEPLTRSYAESQKADAAAIKCIKYKSMLTGASECHLSQNVIITLFGQHTICYCLFGMVTALPDEIMLWNMAILACSSALAAASFCASRSCLTACCLILQSSFLDSLHHRAIFHVTHPLDFCSLFDTYLVRIRLTVLVCLPMVSRQCDCKV